MPSRSPRLLASTFVVAEVFGRDRQGFPSARHAGAGRAVGRLGLGAGVERPDLEDQAGRRCAPAALLSPRHSRWDGPLLKEFYGRGLTRTKSYYEDDLVVCVLRGGFCAWSGRCSTVGVALR